MSTNLPYAANCSLLFREVDLLERPAAAKAAGFDAIEFWWPWSDEPVPADSTIDEFVTAVRDSGVQLIGLNFFAGDLFGPDCGVLSIPARSAQFTDNIDVAVGIGEALGVGALNALYGNRVDDVTPEEQDELGLENLDRAAAAAAKIGAKVLVEPVSGPKPYPLRTADDVIKVLDRVDADNVGFLFDLFHLANNGDDLDAAIKAYADRISPCADRRLSRPRRTGQRHPRPPALSRCHRGRRLLRSCRSRVQPDHHDPGQPRLAALRFLTSTERRSS